MAQETYPPPPVTLVAEEGEEAHRGEPAGAFSLGELAGAEEGEEVAEVVVMLVAEAEAEEQGELAGTQDMPIKLLNLIPMILEEATLLMPGEMSLVWMKRTKPEQPAKLMLNAMFLM